MARLRRLTIDDYARMVALWERSSLPFKPKGRDSRKEIAHQMKRTPDLFVGAFDGRELVGVGIGSCDGRKGWINRLAVDPIHRRRGVARHLIGRIEAALRQRGARVICALVETSNPESIALFGKLGYVVHGDLVYLSKRESEDV